MPIPTPSENESKDKYMSRCIHFLKKENSGRKHSQVVAICYSTWEKYNKSSSSSEKGK